MVLKYVSLPVLKLVINIVVVLPITILYVPTEVYTLYGLAKLKVLIFEVAIAFPIINIIGDKKLEKKVISIDLWSRIASLILCLLFLFFFSEGEELAVSIMISSNIFLTFLENYFLIKNSKENNFKFYRNHYLIFIIAFLIFFLFLHLSKKYSYILFLPLIAANTVTMIYRIYIIYKSQWVIFHSFKFKDVRFYFSQIIPSFSQIGQSFFERIFILKFFGENTFGFFQYSLQFRSIFQQISNGIKNGILNKIKNYTYLYHYKIPVGILIISALTAFYLVSISNFSSIIEYLELDAKNNNLSFRLILVWGLLSIIQLFHFPFERKLSDLRMYSTLAKTQSLLNLSNILISILLGVSLNVPYVIPFSYILGNITINQFRKKFVK